MACILLSSSRAQEPRPAEPNLEFPVEDGDESGQTVRELKPRQEDAPRDVGGDAKVGKTKRRIELDELDENDSSPLDTPDSYSPRSPVLELDRDDGARAVLPPRDEMQDLVSLSDEDEDLPWRYVESAARHRQNIGMSPSAVTVITRQDIETSGAATVPDLLRLVPGMDVVAATVNVRSLSSRMYWTYENNVYLVLLDGRDVTFDLFGQPTWQTLPVQLEDIERIEVIRGPGSALYGANAFVGVVNIVSREIAERTSGAIRGTVGEVGSYSAGARASSRLGRFGLSLNGGFDRSDSWKGAAEPGKQDWMLRILSVFEISEQTRILAELSHAQGEGELDMFGPIRMGVRHTTLRLAYDSMDLKAQLFWTHEPIDLGLKGTLAYQGMPLGVLEEAQIDTHTIDGQIQWNLPRLASSLNLILGGNLRLNGLLSDDLLDGETFADPDSPRFHEPGIESWEVRSGLFGQAEWSAADWVTVTAGVRLDHSSATGAFLSPRLAAVFHPAETHFLRLGVGRSFRRASFQERSLHPQVGFPAGSILASSPDLQWAFQEFMTRVLGNSRVDQEESWSFELGYLGLFVQDRLQLSLDLYYSTYRGIITMNPQLVDSTDILQMLNGSSVRYEQLGKEDCDTLGLELLLRWMPTRRLALQAGWTYRGVQEIQDFYPMADTSPKNLFTLGGRFHTDLGLLGSLYVFTRSEFWDRLVENPEGGAGLAPQVAVHSPNLALLLARLGYEWTIRPWVRLELGVTLFLPLAPLDDPQIGYYERLGGVTDTDPPLRYGGHRLPRIAKLYLQGTF